MCVVPRGVLSISQSLAVWKGPVSAQAPGTVPYSALVRMSKSVCEACHTTGPGAVQEGVGHGHWCLIIRINEYKNRMQGMLQGPMPVDLSCNHRSSQSGLGYKAGLVTDTVPMKLSVCLQISRIGSRNHVFVR